MTALNPRRPSFEDHFDGRDLDRRVWLPHYLPAWSSSAATRATYELVDSCVRLAISPDQGVWCDGDHEPRMRVSGIQSGNYSGPVGSTVGQQPYRDGLTVQEEQLPFWGWTPHFGSVELRARGEVTPRSMMACWMVGLEDVPERSAEICIAEVFGDAVVVGRSAAVGMGLHAFRDPQVAEDFEAVRLPIDVSEFHTYAVDWTRSRVDFLVDGELVRSSTDPPGYPMQLMLGVFDFPDRATEADADAVPAFVVDYVRASALHVQA